jgi:hypothetical protein
MWSEADIERQKRADAERSGAALKFNIDRLSESGRLYLWTFTLPMLCDVEVGCRLWSQLCKALVEGVGFYGVRVFELHETHGLHVHAVSSGYFPVSIVRAICSANGWGRVHVCRITRNPYYVAKYVSKGKREGAFKGRRVWGCFGKWVAAARTLVKDVGCDSMSARSFRVAWDSVAVRVLRVAGRGNQAYLKARATGARDVWESLTGDRAVEWSSYVRICECIKLGTA